jgi:hypothetical protein
VGGGTVMMFLGKNYLMKKVRCSDATASFFAAKFGVRSSNIFKQLR